MQLARLRTIAPVIFLPNHTRRDGYYVSKNLLRTVFKCNLHAIFFYRRHTDNEIHSYNAEIFINMIII